MAVEEQITTTNAINESAKRAALGCGDVVSNVDLTASTAQDAWSAATESRKAVVHLSTLADELEELVMFYKVD